MLQCPYQTYRADPPASHGVCSILTVASGFVRSCSGALCAKCINNQEWSIKGAVKIPADAPPRAITKTEALHICKMSDWFRSLYCKGLRSRLIAGDCPRYQMNPVDVDDVFQRLAVLEPERKEELYDTITLHWMAMPETFVDKHGVSHPNGHPVETVRAKLLKIANDNGLAARYIEHEWIDRSVAKGMLENMNVGGCANCGKTVD